MKEILSEAVNLDFFSADVAIVYGSVRQGGFRQLMRVGVISLQQLVVNHVDVIRMVTKAGIHQCP